MGRSQETFNKKEREKKRQKKKKDKAERKAQRKLEASENKKSFEDMIMYVDHNGNLTPNPPDLMPRPKIKIEDIEISVPKSEKVDLEDGPRTGTVKFFNDEKGYGFIVDNMSSESLFVHIGDVAEPIKEGNRVSYTIEKGPKGLVAKSVQIDRT